MKLKKVLNRFTLFLILFTSASSIASGQSKDSVKYSIEESKAVLDAYLNLPKALSLVDSCEKEIVEYKAIIKNDSIDKVADVRADKLQADLVSAYKEKAETKEKDYKFANFWRRFWKTTAGVLSIPAGVGVYNVIKE